MKKQTGLTKTIFVIIIVVISMVFGVTGIVYINTNSLQDSSDAQISDLASARDAQIIITDSGFFPQTLIVSKDQAVTWTNKDNKNHEVTFSSRSLLGLSTFSTGIIAPNESFTFTFEQKETINYIEVSTKQLSGQIVAK